MRSNWKVKPYIRYGYSNVESSIDLEESRNINKLFVRKGFLNPLFYDKRVSVYRGNSFKNFKVRAELVDFTIGSFVITRPAFNSIRVKFKGIKK
jgi:ribosomal protein S19